MEIPIGCIRCLTHGVDTNGKRILGINSPVVFENNLLIYGAIKYCGIDLFVPFYLR